MGVIYGYWIVVAVVVTLAAVGALWQLNKTIVVSRPGNAVRKARLKEASLRESDVSRTATNLVSQYNRLEAVRQDLQEAIDDHDRAVATNAPVVTIAATEAKISALQQTLQQEEEILRLRERSAKRLYPEQFKWL